MSLCVLVGVLSAGTSQLPPMNVSPLKIGVETSYSTPSKAHSSMRHSLLSSGSTPNSTPSKPSQINKRSSEKPKSSFLSRVTSRPSLTFRYSSADLKSASKSRPLFGSSERRRPSPTHTPPHPIITVQVPDEARNDIGADSDFFTSPRAAPTPPNLNFTPRSNMSRDSFPGPSQSTVTLPSRQISGLFSDVVHVSPVAQQFKRSPRETSSPSKAGRSPFFSSPASLSLEAARRSPNNRTSPLAQSPYHTNACVGSHSLAKESVSPAKPRPGHVRIGTEKVTLSVANVLETELGIDVGDSESEYSDTHQGSLPTIAPVRISQKPTACADLGINFISDSSDLPPLTSVDDAFVHPQTMSFRSPDDGRAISLESQSPLTALMSASSTRAIDMPSSKDAQKNSVENDVVNMIAENGLSNPVRQMERKDSDSTLTRPLSHSKSFYLHPSSDYLNNGTHVRNVDRLECISERSEHASPDKVWSPRDRVERKTETTEEVASASLVKLQQSLDIQCARFDRLAKHLLDIIQRHQNEKVHLESQIATLEKEARKREREIKGLRWLMDKNKASTQDLQSRRLARVASLQSLLTNARTDGKGADTSVLAEVLCSIGLDDSSVFDAKEKDSRASVELSPSIVPFGDKSIALRRSKTLPDLHRAGAGQGQGQSKTPPLPEQSPSPDVSGLGLGLDFPLPEPLKLPSIATTILSAAGSNASVPALTTAPTATSGLSLATSNSMDAIPPALPTVAPLTPGGNASKRRMNSSEKRKAGEWCPGLPSYYKPSPELLSGSEPGSPSAMAAAAAAYANNLNRSRLPNMTQVLKKADSGQSLDLEALYDRLVSNADGLLG